MARSDTPPQMRDQGGQMVLDEYPPLIWVCLYREVFMGMCASACGHVGCGGDR